MTKPNFNCSLEYIRYVLARNSPNFLAADKPRDTIFDVQSKVFVKFRSADVGKRKIYDEKLEFIKSCDCSSIFRRLNQRGAERYEEN